MTFFAVVRGELLPAAAGPLLLSVAHPGGHGGHQRARRPRHEEDARAALQNLVTQFRNIRKKL